MLAMAKVMVADAGTITAMHWSADSQLLALVLSGSGPETKSSLQEGSQSSGMDSAAQPADASHAASRLQIWHRSNWHWYLKADMPFSPDACGVTAKWDEEHPLRLHLCDGTGGYRQVPMNMCLSSNAPQNLHAHFIDIPGVSWQSLPASVRGIQEKPLAQA